MGLLMLTPYRELPAAVHVLCLGTLINRAGTLLLPFLTLYLTRELGFSVEFASLAMGAIGLGSIIGALGGGSLADRFGRRWVMLFSLFGGAGVLLCFGRITSAYAIVLALIAFSALGNMYRPAAAAMIGDLVPSEQRPFAFGLMYFAINLGFPIGTVVGGIVAEVWFRGLFVIDALTAIAYATIILFFIRETLPKAPHSAVGADGLSSNGSGSAAGNPEPDPAALPSALRHILADGPFLVFCLAALLLGVTYVQSFSTLPIFMQSHGISVGLYGKLIAINGALIAIVQIPLTAWMRRFNRVTFVWLSAVVTGVGFGTTALADSAGFFAATIVVWTVGEIMIAPFSHAIVTDMAPVAFRARYLGVFSMCFASANMLGAPLGGLVLEQSGGKALWGTALALC